MKIFDRVNLTSCSLGTVGIAICLGVLLGVNSIFATDASDELPGSAADGEIRAQNVILYGAVITPLGDRQVQGYAVILPVADDGAEIMVDAHGVEASVEHMQHIHSGSSCSNIGGVLLPLEPYPEANSAGEIHYRERFDEVPENAGNRVVVVHGADGTPVACGEFDPVRE
jgi:hypothetical protein